LLHRIFRKSGTNLLSIALYINFTFGEAIHNYYQRISLFYPRTSFIIAPAK
jgi:hypothetical protein